MKQKYRSRLVLTWEGKLILLIETVLLFAAVNSGKNLLFLMFCVLFSSSVFNLISPFLHLRNLKLELDGPLFLFAGESVSLPVRVTNLSRLTKRLLVFSIPDTEIRQSLNLLPIYCLQKSNNLLLICDFSRDRHSIFNNNFCFNLILYDSI